MNDKLTILAQQVTDLHSIAEMLTKSEFKSDEAKGFNAGSEFALANVLKLIYNLMEK